MPDIHVVSDTASDLPPDLAERHGIDLVPLTVRFGAEELVDRKDLTPADFWARVATSPVLPETAAPSPGAFEEAYRRAAGAGAAGVVCVTISSALSATYEAARLGAEAVADTIPVRVVDSRAVSMSEGTVALTAARLAEEGHDLDGVAKGAEEMVPRTRTFAALDTLENLRKGGRIGAAQALLGSMLSIKPIIEVANGKVEPESKQRTRGRSLRYLADKVRQSAPVENLAVLHGSAPDLDEMLGLLADICPRDQIMVGDVGPVIGTHAGPRVMGVTFTVPS
ncbi:MAG: DegV family protein [Acidimicrobiales bacterium]